MIDTALSVLQSVSNEADNLDMLESLIQRARSPVYDKVFNDDSARFWDMKAASPIITKTMPS
jgi:hypothetical protein